MRKLILVVAVLVLSGCAGNYKTTFDHGETMQPITVAVVPVMTKEEIDVQIVVADSTAITAQYGLIGALVGSVIDSVANKRASVVAERRAEILRELSGDYDILNSAHQSSLNIGNHEHFEILTISDPKISVGWDELADNAFEAGDAAAVAVLDFDYGLTPATDQVRVNVDQRLYLSSMEKKSDKPRKPKSHRVCTYYSPMETIVRSLDFG